jgi:amidase
MPDRITRRSFLKASTTAGAAGALAGTGTVAGAGVALAGSDDHGPSFPFEEKTIAELQAAMTSGRLSSRRLTRAYLQRIRRIDLSGIQLNSVIEVNPDALETAAALDAERRQGKVRGPLHGVPILVKDNFATRDKMETTAGSLALLGAEVPRDAFVIRQLRRAGAVILGKTNLSEWANFRSTQSSSGWSGRAGQCASAPMCWTTTRAAPAPGRGRHRRPTCAREPWGPRPTGRSSAPPPTTPSAGSSRPWG